MRLRGQLDVRALQAALQRIVERHEVLRTTFITEDGIPVQSICPAEESRVVFTLEDLTQRTDAENCWQTIADQEAREPFDLATGPLMRTRLLAIAENEHILLVTQHHIISDGWSISVFVDELSVLYCACTQGQPDPLPGLAIQYADYAHWQRHWLSGERLQQQSEFWKTALQGAPQLLELPGDSPRPAEQSYAGDSVEIRLDSELGAQLKHFSHEHQSTLFMTLLAAWAVLLSRLSGQNQVVIGTPTANRNRVEVEKLMGLFVNTWALPIALSEQITFNELIQQVKQLVLNAQQHQDIPFEQVVEILQPTRSLAHAPLFQVMFAWQNTPEEKLQLPGLSLSIVEQIQSSAQFDLSLSLGEYHGEIAGNLNYASALFKPETIERYLGYWQTLLKALVTHPEHSVYSLPILDSIERQQVLYDFNATQTDYPKDQCIHELFEAQVAKTPDAIALVYEQQQLTYAGLNAKANQLAQYLSTQGVVPDSRVAICVERGLNMVIALLAVLKAGGAYVPLDPAYPKHRLEYMLTDSTPVVLLTDSSQSSLADSHPNTLVILLDQHRERWQQLSTDNLPKTGLGLTSHNLAYVIYTSGSTGLPKGVMVEHSRYC